MRSFRVLLLLLVLFASFGGFVNAASPGYMSGKPIYLIDFVDTTDISKAKSSSLLATDGDPNTFVTLDKLNSGNNRALFNFSAATNLGKIHLVASGQLRIIFIFKDGARTGNTYSPGDYTFQYNDVTSIWIDNLSSTTAVKLYEIDFYGYPPSGVSLTTASVAYNNVTLNLASNYADSLQVIRDGVVVATLPGTAKTYTDTKVTPNTSYQYILKAINNAAEVSSTTLSVKTPDPPTPSNVTLDQSDLVHDSVKLTASGNNLQYFKFYRGGELVGTVYGSPAVFYDRNLKEKTSYSYYAEAYNYYVVTKSNAVTFITPEKPLPPLVTPVLSSDLLKDTSVRLVWDKDFSTTYDVYQNGSKIGTTSVGVYSVPSLTPETDYSFHLIATDQYGRNATSNTIKVKTLALALVKPSIRFSDLTFSGFVVNWQAVPGAKSYEVLLDGKQVFSTSSKLSYEFTGLSPSTSYNVTVRALNGLEQQESSLSTTTAKKPAPRIENATVTSIPGSPGTKSLSYTPNQYVTAVRVYVGGKLIGEYPVSQGEIKLDVSDVKDLIVPVKIEPVDEGGESYEISAPGRSTGNAAVDDYLAKFLDVFDLSKGGFVFLALGAIPLLIVVLLFFWFRHKAKKMLGVKTNQGKHEKAEKHHFPHFKGKRKYKHWNKMSDQERLEWQSRRHHKETGFSIKEKKVYHVPVGFMGSGGLKRKVDYTFERNGVEYKKRYVRGKGHVYQPKDFHNKMKQVGNQYNALKRAFTKPKVSSQNGKSGHAHSRSGSNKNFHSKGRKYK